MRSQIQQDFHKQAWALLSIGLSDLSNLYFNYTGKPTVLTLIAAFCSGSFPETPCLIPRLVRGRPPFDNLRCLVRIARGDVSLWDDDEPPGPQQLLVADSSSRAAARGICVLAMSRYVYADENC